MLYFVFDECVSGKSCKLLTKATELYQGSKDFPEFACEVHEKYASKGDSDDWVKKIEHLPDEVIIVSADKGRRKKDKCKLLDQCQEEKLALLVLNNSVKKRGSFIESLALLTQLKGICHEVERRKQQGAWPYLKIEAAKTKKGLSFRLKEE